MSVKTLTVTDVARHFSDYVNRVAYRNERFILRKGRRIMAELRPITAGRSLGELPDIISSLPRLSECEIWQPHERMRGCGTTWNPRE